jgi:Domain of unknown function (DUF4118)
VRALNASADKVAKSGGTPLAVAKDGQLLGISKPAKPRRTEIKAYIASLAYVAAAILVAALLRQALGISKPAQVFLIAVLASAVTYGLWASLFACLVSALAYNFFSCLRSTHLPSPIPKISSPCSSLPSWS